MHSEIINNLQKNIFLILFGRCIVIFGTVDFCFMSFFHVTRLSFYYIFKQIIARFEQKVHKPNFCQGRLV